MKSIMEKKLRHIKEWEEVELNSLMSDFVDLGLMKDRVVIEFIETQKNAGDRSYATVKFPGLDKKGRPDLDDLSKRVDDLDFIFSVSNDGKYDGGFRNGEFIVEKPFQYYSEIRVYYFKKSFRVAIEKSRSNWDTKGISEILHQTVINLKECGVVVKGNVTIDKTIVAEFDKRGFFKK